MKPNEILDELIYLVDSEYCGLKEHKPCMEYLKLLKNIEEELEIDLATLFKALYCGIWLRLKGRDDYDAVPCLTNIGYKGWCFINKKKSDYVYLRDYGKTWALSKDELK